MNRLPGRSRRRAASQPLNRQERCTTRGRFGVGASYPTTELRATNCSLPVQCAAGHSYGRRIHESHICVVDGDLWLPSSAPYAISIALSWRGSSYCPGCPSSSRWRLKYKTYSGYSKLLSYTANSLSVKTPPSTFASDMSTSQGSLAA